ncbi:hypothetical protein NFI96_008443 [Prochilodus magdalenae]|nr:hypothetical protein NFI96_008443 [Prochilodus magdalenae]
MCDDHFLLKSKCKLKLTSKLALHYLHTASALTATVHSWGLVRLFLLPMLSPAVWTKDEYLPEVVRFLDTTYGDGSRQIALAMNVPKEKCSKGVVPDQNFLLDNDVNEVKAVMNGPARVYKGQQLIGAKPKPIGKKRSNYHSEYLLLINSNPSETSTDDHPMKELLDRDPDGCVVFYTFNSPCVKTCSTPNTNYSIIPALENFRNHTGPKAFVFGQAWKRDINTTQWEANIRAVNSRVPLYRCDNTGQVLLNVLLQFDSLELATGISSNQRRVKNIFFREGGVIISINVDQFLLCSTFSSSAPSRLSISSDFFSHVLVLIIDWFKLGLTWPPTCLKGCGKFLKNERFGGGGQFALAFNIPAGRCSADVVPEDNFFPGINPAVVRNAMNDNRVFSGGQLIAARPKPIPDSEYYYHSEYLLLINSNPSPTSPDDHLMKELLDQDPAGCVVFYTFNSPCVNTCSTPNKPYSIIPALENFRNHTGPKAFVFGQLCPNNHVMERAEFQEGG